MALEDNQKVVPRSWLKSLWRRKLVQWAVAYAAGSWLVVQIIATIGPRWGFTDALSRALDILLIVGFFVALIIAWYHGEKGRQRVSGPELLILGALLIVGGLALKLVNRDQGANPPETPPLESASRAAETAAPNPLQSIAVLPFDNYSPDPNDAYFAAGITEEITSQLSRIGDLTVLSRVAVERAVESGDSLDVIARTLRAGSVLEGSVRMAQDRVRITAQLIDMSKGQHLWSQSFDRKLDDIFEIQTGVALAIGDALRARLTSKERRRIEKPLTDNIRAYQLYLKQVDLYGNIPEQNLEGIRILEQARELDPGFAAALAREAWRYNWQFWMSGDQQYLDQARPLALQALELDPEVPNAHYAMANVLVSEGRYKQAGEAFDRALEIDPNFSAALSDSSFWHALDGSLNISLERAFRGVQLNPNSDIYRHHAVLPLLVMGDLARAQAWVNLADAEGLVTARLELAKVDLEMMQGNLDDAASRAKSVIETYGDQPEAREWAAVQLFSLGRWKDVSGLIEEMGRDAPNAAPGVFFPRRNQTLMAFVLAESGRAEEANRAFAESLAALDARRDGAPELYVETIDAASIHAYQRRSNAAMALLEQAFDTGLLADFILRIDPMFESLRDDPRFEQLLERIAARKRELVLRAEEAGLFEGFDELIAAGVIEAVTVDHQ